MRVVLARMTLRTPFGKIVALSHGRQYSAIQKYWKTPFGATFLPNGGLNETAENPATSKNIECSQNKDLPPNRSRNINTYTITFCHREKLLVDAEVITQNLGSDWRVGRILEAVLHSLGSESILGWTQHQSESPYPRKDALATSDLLGGGILNRMSCSWKCSVWHTISWFPVHCPTSCVTRLRVTLNRIKASTQSRYWSLV